MSDVVTRLEQVERTGAVPGLCDLYEQAGERDVCGLDHAHCPFQGDLSRCGERD